MIFGSGVVESSLMSERSDAGAMPNTPSAYRLWPQHALSEPSHALGLPSSHTRQPSEDALAALSEPRHTLGLPLSYKRSPLQASHVMLSACRVMPDAIHVCPTKRHAPRDGQPGSA